MILLALSLWFVHPAPLDMPRAEAYFVKGADGALWLEDRYSTLDLWTSQAVLGRWEDDDGRHFAVAKLDVVPPSFDEATRTRAAYAEDRVLLDRKDKSIGDLRTLAVARLAPLELPKEPESPRQQVRGLDEVLYYQGTNRTAIVCAFLPEKSESWYLAVWELVPGDELDSARERFEDEILSDWEKIREARLPSEADLPKRKPGKAAKSLLPERELLRADARHSVTNYATWHVTDGDEFTVLDNLPRTTDFVVTLTNDMKRMRARYAEVVPSPVNGSNVLAVARIFRDRNEYLDAVGDDMKWSAAYWSQPRRELVAHLPEAGSAELLKTIRHEAFHQYLSYAASMIPAAPWFNEGYAQYFEDEESADWQLPDGTPEEEKLELLAASIPAVMRMDYEQFYAGSDVERMVKYRLAWSIAYFLEKGAPSVRLEPFKNLKRDYVKSLLASKDMTVATANAFGSRENLELFVTEWKKFWKNR